MKTRALMIPEPITIPDTATIAEAIEVMKMNSIRHLPVVSNDDYLEGFVTLATLKQGLIPSMVGDVSLRDLMIKNPIRVSPNDDIEHVARIIYKHKISGMPVVEEERIVGIITESDILRAFIDMMGLLTASSRVDVVIGDKEETFRKAIEVIQDSGGEIINVGMAGELKARKIYYFRLSVCQTDKICSALEKEGFEVLDAMD